MSDKHKRPRRNIRYILSPFLLLLLYPLLLISCSSTEKKTIKSKILEEKRTLFIRLPKYYDNSIEKYPVLYILDGHRLIKRPYIKTFDKIAEDDEIPDIIMVGIANIAGILRTSRDRDFHPTGGDAQNFRKFIKQELIPFVDENFRTNSCRILLGHSSAGLFTIFALFSDPRLFNGYISSCPALSSDDTMVFDMARTFVKSSKAVDNYLYIGIGEEEYSDFIQSTEKVIAILNAMALDGLIWEYHRYPDEDHYSTPSRAFYEGVIAFFHAFPVE